MSCLLHSNISYQVKCLRWCYKFHNKKERDYKQLLDEVFRIMKVEVGVISRSRRLRLITLTENLEVMHRGRT